MAHSSTFTVGSDATQPALAFVGYEPGPVALEEAATTLINNVGWETTWPLSLVFEEAMDRDSVADALSLQPAVEYTLQWPAPERAIVAFAGPLLHTRSYTVRRGGSAQDLSANHPEGGLTYRWVVDGPLTEPPTITDIGDDNASLLAPFAVITLDSGQVDYFDWFMQSAVGAGPDLISFLQNLTITVTPGLLSPLALIYLRTELDPIVPPPARALAAEEHVVRVYLDATGGPGLVTLALASDYHDDADNRLGTAWQIVLNS